MPGSTHHWVSTIVSTLCETDAWSLPLSHEFS
jgi:hypothetical protein